MYHLFTNTDLSIISLCAIVIMPPWGIEQPQSNNIS